MPGGGAQACVSMGYCASTADLRINCTFCINTFAQQMAQWLAQPGLLIAQPVQQANTMSGSYYSYNGQSAAPGGAPAASGATCAPRGDAQLARERVPARLSPATPREGIGSPGRAAPRTQARQGCGGGEGGARAQACRGSWCSSATTPRPTCATC